MCFHAPPCTLALVVVAAGLDGHRPGSRGSDFGLHRAKPLQHLLGLRCLAVTVWRRGKGTAELTNALGFVGWPWRSRDFHHSSFMT